MDGDGIELIALADSSAQFDMDVDGFAELTGWVAADDAFLAYDVNGNGIIDDQSELFGNSDAFANGFLSLAALDSNNDGVIDQNDAAYSDLVVWQDGNGDAITDTGELTSLADAGIASIDLGSTSVNETNAGHTVSDRSTVTWDDASTTVIEDIWFEVDQRVNSFILPDNFGYTAEALMLPLLTGMGHITSTWVALSLDGSLVAESKALVEKVNAGDIAGFSNDFEQFLLDWADVSAVDPTSRGTNVDAQHLAFLEKIYGADFAQPGHGGAADISNPNSPAGAAIEAQYDELMLKLMARFMVQSVDAGTMLSVFETGAVPTNPSAVDFLSILGASLTPESFSISGSAYDVFTGIIDAYDSGALSLESANMIIDLLRLDLDDGTGRYDENFFAAVAASGKLVSAADLNPFGENNIDTIGGTDVADTIVGTAAHELIIGGAGDDNIDGGAGDDYLYGGLGNDTVYGSDGSDTYLFTRGDGQDSYEDNGWGDTDTLRISGYTSDEVIFRTGASNNTLVVTFVGTTDQITLVNAMGGDIRDAFERVVFDDGTVWDINQMRDRIIEDMYRGTDGQDNIIGSSGQDFMEGFQGNDIIDGLAGNDILNGGAGDDILTGGSGADIIELDFGSGSDTMTDFQDGIDIIDLSATGLVFADLTIADNGSGDVVISFDDGDAGTALDELTLTGITAAELTSADFQFG